MKIIYVGSLMMGGTSGHRKDALIRLGHEVISIEQYPNLNYFLLLINRFSNKIFKIIFDFKNVNYKILELFKSLNRVDIVWVDNAKIISSKTLKKIKEIYPDIILVHYSPDDMFNPNNQTVAYLNCLPLFDFHITTKSYNVKELKEKGAGNVIFVNNAFEPSIHRKIEISEQNYSYFRSDISFIGSFEKDRFEQVLYLAQNGIKVRVWGSTWRKYMKAHKNLEIIPFDFWQHDYTKVIKATKINLCFLRKVNRDLQTTRSVEIPACGGFLLAERTEEHMNLFREGIEAEFFSNRKELFDKICYYLNNPLEIERIRNAGYHKCLSNFSNDKMLSYILQHLT